jgi:hypothetical protein
VPAGEVGTSLVSWYGLYLQQCLHPELARYVANLLESVAACHLAKPVQDLPAWQEGNPLDATHKFRAQLSKGVCSAAAGVYVWSWRITRKRVSLEKKNVK